MGFWAPPDASYCHMHRTSADIAAYEFPHFWIIVLKTMQSTLRELEALARETGVSEDELITRALRTGVRQLRREQVLDQYLREKISREEAVRRAGLHWVKQAERERQAVEEDIAWATGE